MQIGRFFSLQQGRVGQYLSSRVLVVRTPFQSQSYAGQPTEFCYFGFRHLRQAQKFTQSLAGKGYRFQLQPAQFLTQYPYEVKLWGNPDLARVLASWDRLDQKRASSSSTRSPLQAQPAVSLPAIAA